MDSELWLLIVEPGQLAVLVPSMMYTVCNLFFDHLENRVVGVYDKGLSERVGIGREYVTEDWWCKHAKERLKLWR